MISALASVLLLLALAGCSTARGQRPDVMSAGCSFSFTPDPKGPDWPGNGTVQCDDGATGSFIRDRRIGRFTGLLQRSTPYAPYIESRDLQITPASDGRLPPAPNCYDDGTVMTCN